MANKLYQFLLRICPCSGVRLKYLGFDEFKRHSGDISYHLGDLAIYYKDRKFHYFSADFKKVRIRNIKQVSNLIYGKTQYLR